MNIRRATLDDISDVMKIETSSFVSGIRECQETFEKRMQVFPEGFLLLEENEVVAGYFTSEIWPENVAGFELNHDIKNVHVYGGTVLYISSIAILPEFRGNGTGKKFFSECVRHVCAEYPKIKKSVLIVNENWTAARKIYSGQGYDETGCLESFFFDGDAIKMEKKIEKVEA